MTKRLPCPPRFKKYVDELFDYVLPRMNLGEYRIEWKYVKRITGEPGLKPIVGTERGFAAEVCIDHAYLLIDINVSPLAYELFQEKNYARLAIDLIHELAHTYTSKHMQMLEDRIDEDDTETLERLRDIDEAMVERIARSIFAGVPREIWTPLR